VDEQGPEQRPHLPPPSLWPVGFAVGVAVLLTGLVVGWHIVILGGVLALAFGFLWVRDLMSERRPAAPAPVAPAEAPPGGEEELERYPRSKFLEGATLGLGGVIGGIVTVPAIGFMIAPAFVDQGHDDQDIGALDDFPEGEWRIVTYLSEPEAGEVSRRTVYVRNNGLLDGSPSFTIVSNRCVHLGCPVQPNGPIDEEAREEEETGTTRVARIPVNPAGFGCPCHGGQYDTEGNRTAGPPVRALDRFNFAVRDGRLLLTNPYSVGKVQGQGKEAVVVRYEQTYPGNHVDGPEAWFYPVQPPR
jgi:Rieske Fe-S protein